MPKWVVVTDATLWQQKPTMGTNFLVIPYSWSSERPKLGSYHKLNISVWPRGYERKVPQALELEYCLLSFSHQAELLGLILSAHDVVHDGDQIVSRPQNMAFASCSTN